MDFHFADGTLAGRGCTDANGLRQGNYFELWTSGDTAYSLTYKNDSIDGIVRHYHKEGSLKYIMEYRMNRLWNVILYIDNKGETLDPGTVHDGNGMLKLYYDSGMPRSTGPLLDGYREGEWRFYSMDPKIYYSEIFTRGVDPSTGRRDVLFD